MTTIKEYMDKRKETQLQKKIKQKEKTLEQKIAKAKAIEELRENLKEEEPKKEEPKKELGLREQLKEVSEKLNNITQETKVKKEIKKKAFKLPLRVKMQLKRLAMKSKVQVILLQNNGNIKPTIAEIKCGMVMVGDKVHDGSPAGVWLWNGKFPTMVIPEWDLRPVTKEWLYNDAVEKKCLSDPQTLIIRAMEWKESLIKKGIGSKGMIFAGIGAIIVMYVLFAGG